jgi:pyruvate,water dikinase
MIELTRSLSALRSADEPSFGGKSTSLGELIANDINVPPGFAASTRAFDLFLESDALGERVATRMTGVDPDDVAAVNRAAEEIALDMRRTPLPDALRAEVGKQHRVLAETTGKHQPPTAVRSSARGEDSADATFAGQQETYLWVRGVDGICEAIRGCWISLYSPSAISYRARLAAEDEAPAMGVAVQLMVDAQTSGVMFTCSPINGDPSVVAVNASWGLGLGVVGGEVTPDDFVLSKVTREVLRRTINNKAVEYVPDPGGRGTHRVAVPEERRNVATLDEERLKALVDLAQRVERHFGTRQDIEWAIARTGTFPENLYILQSRPVTVAATGMPPALGDRRDAMSLLLGTFGVQAKGD